MTHRWSGWPGAWCLDCGCEDPYERAFGDNNFIEVEDDSDMGFHYEFPNVKETDCPCPNTYGYDPYFQIPWGKLIDELRWLLYGLPREMRWGDLWQ